MNDVEVGVFLAWLSAVDNRIVTDEAIDAWTDVLPGWVSIDDAKAAAGAHFRARPGEYLMPAHIVTGVRDIRGARLAACPNPLPLVSPDDVGAFQVQRRALIEAIASGRVDPSDGAAMELVRAEVARQVGAGGHPKQIGA